MVTLGRMTGKDFSGPVPEIRVPTNDVSSGVDSLPQQTYNDEQIITTEGN